MVTERGRKRLPPYVSYRTFRNFVDGLQEGIPARIDRSYWGDKWSGSTGTQLVGALRFLRLIDSNGIPTSQLKQLVPAKGAQRAEILKQIGSEAYGFLLQSSFEPETATYGQLEEAFHDAYQQLTSDVARKCTKFFIGLARDAGISLSPFIIKRSKTKVASTKTKRIAQKVRARTNGNSTIPQNVEEIPGQISWNKMLLIKFPTFEPTWPDEVKLKWFEAFSELLRRSFSIVSEK